MRCLAAIRMSFACHWHVIYQFSDLKKVPYKCLTSALLVPDKPLPNVRNGDGLLTAAELKAGSWSYTITRPREIRVQKHRSPLRRCIVTRQNQFYTLALEKPEDCQAFPRLQSSLQFLAVQGLKSIPVGGIALELYWTEQCRNHKNIF